MDKDYGRNATAIPEEPVNRLTFGMVQTLNLKITNVAGYRNYDKSSFKPVSALYDADETKLEATYNSMFDVAEFVDPTNYKTYDELKQRLSVVLEKQLVKVQLKKWKT